MVWGEIPGEAILGGFSITDFLAHSQVVNPNLRHILSISYFQEMASTNKIINYMKKTHIPMNKLNGNRVGQFLASANLSHITAITVALNTARMWRFRSGHGYGKEQFLKGVEEGVKAYKEERGLWGPPSRITYMRIDPRSPTLVPTVPPQPAIPRLLPLATPLIPSIEDDFMEQRRSIVDNLPPLVRKRPGWP